MEGPPPLTPERIPLTTREFNLRDLFATRTPKPSTPLRADPELLSVPEVSEELPFEEFNIEEFDIPQDVPREKEREEKQDLFPPDISMDLGLPLEEPLEPLEPFSEGFPNLPEELAQPDFFEGLEDSLTGMEDSFLGMEIEPVLELEPQEEAAIVYSIAVQNLVEGKWEDDVMRGTRTRLLEERKKQMDSLLFEGTTMASSAVKHDGFVLPTYHAYPPGPALQSWLLLEDVGKAIRRKKAGSVDQREAWEDLRVVLNKGKTRLFPRRYRNGEEEAEFLRLLVRPLQEKIRALLKHGYVVEYMGASAALEEGILPRIEIMGLVGILHVARTVEQLARHSGLFTVLDGALRKEKQDKTIVWTAGHVVRSEDDPKILFVTAHFEENLRNQLEKVYSTEVSARAAVPGTPDFVRVVAFALDYLAAAPSTHKRVKTRARFGDQIQVSFLTAKTPSVQEITEQQEEAFLSDSFTYAGSISRNMGEKQLFEGRGVTKNTASAHISLLQPGLGQPLTHLPMGATTHQDLHLTAVVKAYPRENNGLVVVLTNFLTENTVSLQIKKQLDDMDIWWSSLLKHRTGAVKNKPPKQDPLPQFLLSPLTVEEMKLGETVWTKPNLITRQLQTNGKHLYTLVGEKYPEIRDWRKEITIFADSVIKVQQAIENSKLSPPQTDAAAAKLDALGVKLQDFLVRLVSTFLKVVLLSDPSRRSRSAGTLDNPRVESHYQPVARLLQGMILTLEKYPSIRIVWQVVLDLAHSVDVGNALVKFIKTYGVRNLSTTDVAKLEGTARQERPIGFYVPKSIMELQSSVFDLLLWRAGDLYRFARSYAEGATELISQWTTNFHTVTWSRQVEKNTLPIAMSATTFISAEQLGYVLYSAYNFAFQKALQQGVDINVEEARKLVLGLSTFGEHGILGERPLVIVPEPELLQLPQGGVEPQPASTIFSRKHHSHTHTHYHSEKLLRKIRKQEARVSQQQAYPVVREVDWMHHPPGPPNYPAPLPPSAPIHTAVLEWDHTKLKKLLEEDVDVNLTDTQQRYTALHYAAYKGNEEAALQLISAGADINARTKVGETPLFLAAKYDKAQMVAFLLEQGADPNLADDAWWTPLHVAAKKANLPIVLTLLSHGAEKNALDVKGKRPFDLVPQGPGLNNRQLRQALALGFSDNPAACPRPTPVAGQTQLEDFFSKLSGAQQRWNALQEHKFTSSTGNGDGREGEKRKLPSEFESHEPDPKRKVKREEAMKEGIELLENLPVELKARVVDFLVGDMEHLEEIAIKNESMQKLIRSDYVQDVLRRATLAAREKMERTQAGRSILKEVDRRVTGRRTLIALSNRTPKSERIRITDPEGWKKLTNDYKTMTRIATVVEEIEEALPPQGTVQIWDTVIEVARWKEKLELVEMLFEINLDASYYPALREAHERVSQEGGVPEEHLDPQYVLLSYEFFRHYHSYFLHRYKNSQMTDTNVERALHIHFKLHTVYNLDLTSFLPEFFEFNKFIPEKLFRNSLRERMRREALGPLYGLNLWSEYRSNFLRIEDWSAFADINAVETLRNLRESNVNALEDPLVLGDLDRYFELVPREGNLPFSHERVFFWSLIFNKATRLISTFLRGVVTYLMRLSREAVLDLSQLPLIENFLTGIHGTEYQRVASLYIDERTVRLEDLAKHDVYKPYLQYLFSVLERVNFVLPSDLCEFARQTGLPAPVEQVLTPSPEVEELPRLSFPESAGAHVPTGKVVNFCPPKLTPTQKERLTQAVLRTLVKMQRAWESIGKPTSAGANGEVSDGEDVEMELDEPEKKREEIVVKAETILSNLPVEIQLKVFEILGEEGIRTTRTVNKEMQHLAKSPFALEVMRKETVRLRAEIQNVGGASRNILKAIDQDVARYSSKEENKRRKRQGFKEPMLSNPKVLAMMLFLEKVLWEADKAHRSPYYSIQQGDVSRILLQEARNQENPDIVTTWLLLNEAAKKNIEASEGATELEIFATNYLDSGFFGKKLDKLQKGRVIDFAQLILMVPGVKKEDVSTFFEQMNVDKEDIEIELTDSILENMDFSFRNMALEASETTGAYLVTFIDAIADLRYLRSLLPEGELEDEDNEDASLMERLLTAAIAGDAAVWEDKENYLESRNSDILTVLLRMDKYAYEWSVNPSPTSSPRNALGAAFFFPFMQKPLQTLALEAAQDPDVFDMEAIQLEHIKMAVAELQYVRPEDLCEFERRITPPPVKKEESIAEILQHFQNLDEEMEAELGMEVEV